MWEVQREVIALDGTNRLCEGLIRLVQELDMADSASKNINAVAFRSCFLEVFGREQLCKVINQLLYERTKKALRGRR